MSIPTDLMLDPDRDRLPPTSGDPEPERSPDATFKVPYPCKSPKALKAITHAGLFQPVPIRRVPALHQPWLQAQTQSAWTKPQTFSTFRERRAAWEEHQRERNPLCFGWDGPLHYHGPFSGNHRANYPGPGIHPDHFHHQFKLKPVAPETEGDYGPGVRHRWEAPTLREQFSLNAERLSTGRHRGPHVKRRDKQQVSHSHAGPVSRASFNTHRRSHWYAEDHGEPMYKHSTTGVAAEHPFSRRGSSLRLLPPSSGDSFTGKFTSAGAPEDVAEPPVLLSQRRPHAPSSSSSPVTIPWLLPHFAAGSLIELRDGRLSRVEDLKTEDFLLGSLACPQLRLSCCTVQDISPSAASASFSHLLILLHDQRSQESVDVYAEYPFFVRGRGWSSCRPQGTARLCGLQCRQLSVGDVCLALTPVSPPHGFT